ncbi:hypothetical protein DEO72_LG10g2712 [Vigna unguiculata]|uniref:Uncharacterized protein n=1 Tax=Vigna unguiculata TaxID=3917 RepID=A0A4D6NG03_VIGUN|nr:hypothetical protein DEO72_LG10g2712 [Vigna unguiculata]
MVNLGDKKSEGRSRVDRDADNLQLQQLEEKDVVSSVATVLSDLCGPGEWMPMEKLHAELLEQYSSVWHHSRVRRYLTSEDWPGPESKGKPWYGLLMLLRKYPEHFVINTSCCIKVVSALSEAESVQPKERKRSVKQVLGAILEGPLEEFYQDTFNFDLARRRNFSLGKVKVHSLLVYTFRHQESRTDSLTLLCKGLTSYVWKYVVEVNSSEMQ